jgi:hypothetical protein
LVAAFIGCLLITVTVTIGTEDKWLARFDPRLQGLFTADSKPVSQTLLDEYNHLAMLKATVEMLPYVVILPAVLVGYVGFSCAVVDRWMDQAEVNDANRPHVFEKAFYGLTLIAVLVVWFGIQSTPGGYRECVLRLGVPDSKLSVWEE